MRAPRLWRPVLMLLHWTAFACLTAALIAGNVPAVRWGLAGAVVFWIAGSALFGLRGTPGPALAGPMRRAFGPLHWALLILLCASSGLLLLSEPGPLTGSIRTLCLLTFGAGLLHGIFHMWRHTVLTDGALRNMTPRIIHGIL